MEPTPESQVRMVAELKAEVGQLRSQLRRKESDGIQAVRGEVAEQMRLLREEASEAVQAAVVAKNARAFALRGKAEFAKQATELGSTLVAVREEARVQKEKLDSVVKDCGALRVRVGVKDRMIAARDEKLKLTLEKSKLELEDSEQKLSEAEERAKERLSTIRSMMGRLGGRPIVNRDAEELLECVDSCAAACLSRMTARILAEIGECGSSRAVSPDALMKALRDGGWLPTVWESEAIWEWRMEWLELCSDDLRLAWTPELTWKMRDKLNISMDKLDELRYSLSHNRVGKKLYPRPWVINPWNEKRLNFPQPILPRCGPSGWHRLVKASQERWGLKMDAAGRVAQRSLRATVQLQELRDNARKIVRPCTVDDPLTIV